MTDRNDNSLNQDEFPFEDFEEETSAGGSGKSGGRSGNRNFWVAMGVIAAVFVVMAIILVIVAFVVIPQNRQARLEEAALINAHNTATALAATEFEALQAAAAQITATPTEAPTLEPTLTPVIVLSTDTPEPSPTEQQAGVAAQLDDPGRTATVAALLTQAAGGGTPVASVTPGGPPTPTALPQSGFVEDAGLPGLLGAAVALIVVIFLVRRLRLSSSN